MRRWRWWAWLGLAVLGVALLWLGGYAMRRFDVSVEKKGCTYTLADVTTVNLAPADPGRVRFLALGDTGTGTAGQAHVAEAARQVCAQAGCDFILLLGDNFYPSGVTSLQDPKFASRFEALYGPIGKPVLAVLGNHDVRHPAIYEVLYSLKSATWRMPNYRYEFRAGPARFYAVNSNCGVLDWSVLAHKLDRAPAGGGWRFVFGHHSIYSNGPHGDTDLISRWYWQRYVAPQVDFYLSGHNHDLEHLERPGARTQYIVSGAGGFYGAQGNEYSGRYRKGTDRSAAVSRFGADEGGFVRFEVTAQAVHVWYYSGAGKVLYQFTRQHPSN